MSRKPAVIGHNDGFFWIGEPFQVFDDILVCALSFMGIGYCERAWIGKAALFIPSMGPIENEDSAEFEMSELFLQSENGFLSQRLEAIFLLDQRKDEIVAIDDIVHQIGAVWIDSRARRILSRAFRLWETRFLVASPSSANVLL